MALNWQKYAVPFAGGIDTKTDENVLLPDKLSRLVNGQFTKQGVVQMRPGHSGADNLTVEGTTVNGTAAPLLLGDNLGLVTRGTELCLATEDRLYSYEPSSARWIQRGRYYPATHSIAELGRVNAAQTYPSIAETATLKVVVWEDSRGGIRYSVYNTETGAAYTQDTSLVSSNASRPWAVPIGDSVLITYANHSTNAIYGKLIQAANILGSISTAATEFISDLHSSRRYSVSADDNRVYFIYYSDGSVVTAGVAIAACNILGSVTWKRNISSDVPTVLDCRVDGSSLGVAWYDGSNVDTDYCSTSTGITTSTTSVAVANVVGVAVGRQYNSATFSYAYTVSGASDDLNTTTFSRPDTSFTARHCHLVSSGFNLGTRAAFIVGHESRTGLQNSYYLYTDEGYLAGQLLYQTAVDLPSTYHPAKVWNSTTTALGINRKLDAEGTNGVFTFQGIAQVTFDHEPKVSFADVDGTAYLSGSMLYAYDGQGVAEANLLMYPDMQTADFVASNGSGSLNAGAASVSYSYRVYYVFHRANGERIRSSALTRTVNLGSSDDTVTITIPTLAHTRYHDDHPTALAEDLSNVTIEIYRNVANDTSGIYYKVTGEDPSVTTGNNCFLYNDVTANNVSFADWLSDTAIASREVDYLSRGEIEHIPSPGPTVVRAVGNRVFLAGGAIKEHQVWYSKLRFPGEPAEFSDILVIDDLPGYGGPVTELSNIDTSIVVFKESTVVAVVGEGADNTGVSGGYLSKLVTTDVGCTGAVTDVPQGIMFTSGKGIYLLDGGYNVQYAGAEVEQYNTQTYTSAITIPGTNLAIFLPDSGSAVVYDYLFQQWATWSLEGPSVVSWNDGYAFIRLDDSRVLIRDTSSYTDAGTPYRYTLRTGAIRVDDGLQNFASIRKFQVLGNYSSSHRLRVSMYYNREEAPYENVEWNPATVIDSSTWGSDATWGSGSYWGGNRDGRTYQFEHRPKRMKFSTLRFEFTALSNTEGAAFELMELACEIGIKQGLQKHSATRKY